jgi:NAD+ synthase (glutamine-hydrolysing)
MSLLISIAQLNLVVADMMGNARRIAQAARTAHAKGARLLLTPELSICGYAAEDLFLRPSFISACDDAVRWLTHELAGLSDLTVVVGHPSGHDERSPSVSVVQRHNCASVIRGGRVLHTYAKQALPNYQVFDERRYFTPGAAPCVFEVDGLRMGLLICEDAWFEGPAQQALQAGAQALLVINASPFHVGKAQQREARMAQRAQSVGLPLVYAHMVGGQDELLFDGGSFAVDAQGQTVVRGPLFEEAMVSVELLPQDAGPLWPRGHLMALPDPLASLWAGLVKGVADYVNKSGFPGVLLGLSGGIDSALVLAIAVDALGPQRVRAVMMPSPYTADISLIDARDMAGRLKVRYDELPINPAFSALRQTLAQDFAGLPEDTTEENLQARVRGTLLMALSNKHGALVLTTGNKSEIATGYCTLYGDMAGGFAVIKDVFKTTVFELARWRNANDPFGTGHDPIPQRIISRPPSAELRADQTDQDSLPPYDVLDAVLQRYVEGDESIAQIAAAGFDEAMVRQVAKLVKLSEYKRRQSPIGIRVSPRGFGRDWRYPVTNRLEINP